MSAMDTQCWFDSFDTAASWFVPMTLWTLPWGRVAWEHIVARGSSSCCTTSHSSELCPTGFPYYVWQTHLQRCSSAGVFSVQRFRIRVWLFEIGYDSKAILLVVVVFLHYFSNPGKYLSETIGDPAYRLAADPHWSRWGPSTGQAMSTHAHDTG